MSAVGNRWKDDPDLARRVVRNGLSVLEGSAAVVARIGGLSVLSEEERDELYAFRDRIEAYWPLKKPKHPLCLGVFGPPGSGKSFAVEQLLTELHKGLASGPAKAELPIFRTINLSQLPGPSDLAAALAEIVRWSSGQIPVVFLDEFDSSLGGTPLGWLQWLLAPMQDGVVIDHGHPIELKKAVFVFAGGTADTFETFPSTHEPYFRAAKGPDFVSRLRGHLNIRGPNDWPYRRVRRAVILRLGIQRVAPGLLADPSHPDTTSIRAASLKDKFIDQIVAVGRFRHGARSVEALVEMSTKPLKKGFSAADLPALNVLDSHVDAGPLAKMVVALSAGGKAGKDYKKELDAVWSTLAIRLLELGAGLVYAGALRASGGGFTKLLAKAEAGLPQPLFGDTTPTDDFRVQPRPARVTWIRASTGSAASTPSPALRIDVRKVPGLCPGEFAELDLPSNTDLTKFKHSGKPPPDWKNSADARKQLGLSLAYFRMRALVSRFADAHILLGGKEEGFSGRFPGIAEEAMLSLAYRRPLYICSWFGGAARRIGQVLGLGEPWPIVPACLRRDTHGTWAAVLENAVKYWHWRFQLPHNIEAPLTYEALVGFLRSHALDGPRWPNNGLTAAENRELFRCADVEEIVRLMTKGLRRCASLE